MLEEGDNSIQISAPNHTSTSLTVGYQPKISHFGVKFTYALSSDGDGAFRVPGNAPNDLVSMQKRFKNKALLMQSLYAELMYEAGYGRQTFRIIKNDSNTDNYISVKRLSYTTAELNNYNDVENQVDGTPFPLEALYSLVRDQVSESPQRIKQMVMLGMSSANDEGVRFASTALGDLDMGVVDNLSLYSIPESIADFNTALYNNAMAYPNDVAFPSNESSAYSGRS